MTETTATPPRWFTIAVIGAILFELFGVANYLMDALRSPQALAALPIDQQLMWAATPRWVTIAYAVAVFAGLAGAVALAMRRRWSIPLLGLSLLAVIVQFSSLWIVPRLRSATPPEALVVPVIICLVGAAIYMLAFVALKRDWLR